MLILWLSVFVLSLLVLVKASDYFTDSAEKIGLHFRIPPFIVGVTIVAIGTSVPELISSVFAVVNGSSEIVIGNVLGSNIANIFLILGIAAIVSRHLTVTYELIHVDLPILVSSAFLLALTLWDSIFTRFEALLCLFGVAVYSVYTIRAHKERLNAQVKSDLKLSNVRKLGAKPYIILLLSAVFIYFGAKYTIDAVIALSSLLNVGKEIIAVTAVAFGTSLPELLVSMQAARKNNASMAVGNILGSNIFNTLAVTGVSGLIGALTIPNDMLTFALPVMLTATLLYYFITQDKEITPYEGYFLLMFYLLFVVSTISFFS